MKTSFYRCLMAVLLLLVSNQVEAKKYHFEIKPMGSTEALTVADSLAFLDCPVFIGGHIECFPDNARAMVVDFNNEKEVEEALHELENYFAEHPMEGEYSITAGDLQAHKLVGSSINIRHHSAKHDAAVHEVKSWGVALLFAVVTVIFVFLTIVLFSANRAKLVCRVFGVIANILAIVFGILAAVAIASLAFKYICIILGCAAVLVFALSIFGSFLKGRAAESQKRVNETGWSVNGTVYQTKDAAEEVAKNTGSDIHFKQ